jgi:hypothetical protein
MINFNVSKDEYFSQKNNVINPEGACNVTSMTDALTMKGYTLPVYDKSLSQPEDQLMKFCLENQEVADYYKQKLPAMYANWKAGLSNSYPPNEVHTVLSFAVNKFMGCEVTKFDTNFSLLDFFLEIVERKSPVVTSVNLNPNFGHVICVTGCNFSEKHFENFEKLNINDLLDASYDYEKVAKCMPEEIVYDDSYGKFDFKLNKHINQSGHNNILTFDQFVKCAKPLGDYKTKYAHIFPHTAAAVM